MYVDRRWWSVTSLMLALLFVPTLAAAQGGGPAAGPGPGGGVCHADVQRLCTAAKGQPGGVSSCLRQHEAELGEACRTALPPQGRGGAPPSP